MQNRTTSAARAPLNVSVKTNHIAKPKQDYFTDKTSKNKQIRRQPIRSTSNRLFAIIEKKNPGLALPNVSIFVSYRLYRGVESYYEVNSHSFMLTTRCARRGENWYNRAVSDREKKTPIPLVHNPSLKRKSQTWVRCKLLHAAL